MEALQSIRAFYKPIQPAVGPEDDEVVYQEALAGGACQDFVYCFWQLKTKRTLKNPFVYRVVSDGCIDIFFDHQNPAGNFIMGFCRKYTEFPIGNAFDYIGIRFLPAAFSLLFGVDAKDLCDRSQELKPILPEFSEWMQANLGPGQSFESIVGQLNRKLSALIAQKEFDFDCRFFNALQLIFRRKGHLNMEKDIATGLSSRQLRRIFNFYIGTTPKAFSNVVRFQHILNASPVAAPTDHKGVFLDAGFFDQAHFIRHFKTFYGVTPSEAFR